MDSEQDETLLQALRAGAAFGLHRDDAYFLAAGVLVSLEFDEGERKVSEFVEADLLTLEEARGWFAELRAKGKYPSNYLRTAGVPEWKRHEAARALRRAAQLGERLSSGAEFLEADFSRVFVLPGRGFVSWACEPGCPPELDEELCGLERRSLWSALLQAEVQGVSPRPWGAEAGLRDALAERSEVTGCSWEPALSQVVAGSPDSERSDLSARELTLRVDPAGPHPIGGSSGAVFRGSSFPGCAQPPAHVATLLLDDPALAPLGLPPELLAWGSIPLVYPYCERCDAWMLPREGVLLRVEGGTCSIEGAAEGAARCCAEAPTAYREASRASFGEPLPSERPRPVFEIGGSPRWLQSHAQRPQHPGTWRFLGQHRGPGAGCFYVFVDVAAKRIALTMQAT